MRPEAIDSLEQNKIMDPDDEDVKKQSQWREIVKRLMRNKVAMAGLIIIIVMVVIAIIAPLISPYDPNLIDLGNKNMKPGAGHIFGTDEMGRDILSRVFFGARNSLVLGFGAVGLSLVLGIVLGCIAGFFGGITETIIMRACDIVQAIPGTLLAIVISTAMGSGLFNTVIALSISRIPFTARMIRAQFLNQRGLEYVEAATAINVSKVGVMFRHILPNAISPIIVSSTMGIGSTIMMAASLSYIGLGVQPPTAEWGAMLSGARGVIRYYPYQALVPGIALAILVLALNLFGDGLRDAMDPKLKS